MGFPSATLSAGNLTSLRRDNYRVQQYISLLPNTVVQSTTLASVPSPTSTYAQFTLSATVSASVKTGMTVIVSQDSTIFSGMSIIGIFRVRKAPSGTTLYINESDLPFDNTPGDNYVYILDDYRIQPKLGRFASGVYYKDYDLTFGKPRPLIRGLQSAYAGWVSGGVLTISFAPTGKMVSATGSISSWSWDVDDGTITVGTASTQNITATFPEGFRWVHVTVTDSNGRSLTRHIPVWAHGSTYPPETGFTGAQITGDLDIGYSARIAGFDGIDGYLDETLCCIWRQEYYGTTEENIINNIDFVGRFRSEAIRASGSLEQGTLTDDVEFILEGPGQQLQRIVGPVISMRDQFADDATVWDYIFKLTPYRALAHVLTEHSTFCELHDLDWKAPVLTGIFNEDAYRVGIIGTSQEDMLSVVNDIMQSVGLGGLDFAPDGASRAVSDVRLYRTYSNFIDIVTLNQQDLLSVSLDYDPVKQVSKVDASGAVYNEYSGTFTPYIVPYPRAAGNSGGQVVNLDRQILPQPGNTASARLSALAVSYWYALNTRFKLSVTFPDGYHWIMPNRWDRYQITIGPDQIDRGFEVSTGRWQCVSISIRQDNESGTREVVGEFKDLDVRTSAADEPPDVDYSAELEEGQLPLLEIQQDGNTVMVWNDASVWVTANFKVTNTPYWYDITPTLGANETIQQCVWSYNSPRIYMLTYDSGTTNSRVWYKTNGADLNEAWKAGATVTGQYTLLRPTHEDAHLYIYAPVISSNAVVRFSDDSGQTLSAGQTVGANASTTGFDTIRTGSVTYAAYTGNIGRSTTEAGAYSSYASLSNIVDIVIPRYNGATGASNINITNPYYFAATTTQISANGGSVTPNDGTNNGVGNKANILATPWNIAGRLAAVLNFTTAYKLATAVGIGGGGGGGGGSPWTIHSHTIPTSNNYIRMRRTDIYGNELYISLGTTYLYYSDDYGTTVVQKIGPDTETDGIEVYG